MENFLRQKLLSSNVSILLRVPPILLMDFISSSKYCWSVDGWRIFTLTVNFAMHIPIYLHSSDALKLMYIPNFEVILHFVLQIAGFAVAFLLLIQTTYCLLSVYLSIAAIGVIIWSYILNLEFIKYCSGLLSAHSSLQYELFVLNKTALQVFFYNYVSQTFLAIVFCFSTMNFLYFPDKKYLVGILFIFPTLITAVLPLTMLNIAPDLLTFVTFLVFLYYFTTHLQKLLSYLWLHVMSCSFSFQFVRILNVVMYSWNEFQFTQVLRAYAVIRLIKTLLILLYDYLLEDFFFATTFNFNHAKLWDIVKYITVTNCENIVAICGITSILSYLVDKLVYNPVQKFLLVPDVERNSISPMSSKLFVLLCIQFSVALLEPEPRFIMISNISWITGVSILSRVNLQVCKQLVSISVREIFILKKHLRVLVMSMLILTICIFWLAQMVNSYLPETWLFPVTLFNIEILVSLVISLIVYALNLIHSNSCTVWYELYDYIYYLESSKNVIALCLSVLVLIKGFYNLFETGSILRLLFLFIHFYYNVWCQLVLGWSCWRERRHIYNCVSSLAIASKEEVTDMGGCCAICLSDVCKNIICITRCNHFFHSFCLRKWLCERKTCPICHRLVLHENL